MSSSPPIVQKSSQIVGQEKDGGSENRVCWQFVFTWNKMNLALLQSIHFFRDVISKKIKKKHKPKQNTNPKEIQYSSPAQAAGTEKEIGLQARM